MTTPKTDVAIIGAGAAGLAAANSLSRSGAASFEDTGKEYHRVCDALRYNPSPTK